MTDILRTKAMLNFELYSIPKGEKLHPSIYPALQSPILIRNDSLISEESKAKTMVYRTSHEYLK